MILEISAGQDIGWQQVRLWRILYGKYLPLYHFDLRHLLLCWSNESDTGAGQIHTKC